MEYNKKISDKYRINQVIVYTAAFSEIKKAAVFKMWGVI
jgi:hypothetical protein